MAKPVSQMLSSARYNNQTHTKQDINNCLKLFKSLNAKLEKYTFPNGETKELICLDGTIPVLFRNASYNIPIGIFLSVNHPNEAPICYVRPTRDMTIKTSRHVDGSGRVYLPYLSEWNKHTCDIVGTIQIMQAIFAAMCPVYQKTKDFDSTPSQVTMPPALPSSYYPPPVGPTSGTPSSGPASITMPTPPQPVYPFAAPGSGPTQQPQPYYPPTGTISAEHIRASLLSACQDRYRGNYRERMHQLQDEIEVLKKTSNDLNRGQMQLDDMKKRMASEVIELTEAKNKLRELDDQLQEFIDKYDKEGEDINPDEVYGPTKPVFKQLLEALAEEMAVVDAIYYTGEGLRKDVISLDIFLKSVRELSRRQFMLRALMHKCREKANLPN